MSYIDDSVSPSQHYTYTSFEPYGAHLFFPCFDQPDLKANASFNVILPTNWIAISNTSSASEGGYIQGQYINKITKVKEQNLLMSYLSGKTGNYYIFKQTELLPTYLFCIAAGQYYAVSLPVPQRYRVNLF